MRPASNCQNALPLKTEDSISAALLGKSKVTVCYQVDLEHDNNIMEFIWEWEVLIRVSSTDCLKLDWQEHQKTVIFEKIRNSVCIIFMCVCVCSMLFLLSLWFSQCKIQALQKFTD